MNIIINLCMCHNNSALISVIWMISNIQTCIETPMAKGVQVIEVLL